LSCLPCAVRRDGPECVVMAQGARPDDYGARANQDLIVTRGSGFRKEKNKKKRGSYRGGDITVRLTLNLRYQLTQRIFSFTPIASSSKIDAVIRWSTPSFGFIQTMLDCHLATISITVLATRHPSNLDLFRRLRFRDLLRHV
jgi:hypothetical protein